MVTGEEIDVFYQELTGIEYLRHELEKRGMETEITQDPEEAIIWGMMNPYHWVVIRDGLIYDPMGKIYPLGAIKGQGIKLSPGVDFEGNVVFRTHERLYGPHQ